MKIPYPNYPYVRFSEEESTKNLVASLTQTDKNMERCPSCDKAWVDHPGVVGTCKELRKYKKIVFKIKGALKLPEKYGDKSQDRAIEKIKEIVLEV